MQHVEYGAHNSQTVILLHGGGLSWWNYREVAQILADKYHVVLPILDGHAGSLKMGTRNWIPRSRKVAVTFK